MDDLEQMAWEKMIPVVRKYGITPENFDLRHRRLLRKAVRYVYLSEWQRTQAGMRIPRSCLTSIDRPSEDGTYLLHETLSCEKHELGQWAIVSAYDQAATALRRALEQTGAPPDRYPKLLTTKFIEQSKLGNFYRHVFECDRFAFLDRAFPDRYKPWEFSVMPPGFFRQEEHVVVAVRWLVEEKLGFPMDHLSKVDILREKIAHQVTCAVLRKYGLGGLLDVYGSAEQPLRLAYPGRFYPWSFPSQRKWQGEKGKRLARVATRWVVKKYLKVPPQSAVIGERLFAQFGLGAIFSSRELGLLSSRRVLAHAYPELRAGVH